MHFAQDPITETYSWGDLKSGGSHLFSEARHAGDGGRECTFSTYPVFPQVLTEPSYYRDNMECSLVVFFLTFYFDYYM